jgi:hypothetical protein
MRLRLLCTVAILLEAALTGTGAASAPSVAALANRFPGVVRDVLASDPRAGSEAQFFARLSNLMDGSPMPPEMARVSPAINHLAQAQADLDRGELAAAVAEVRAVRDGKVIAPWLRDAESRLTLDHQRQSSRVRMARGKLASVPQAMPTEIPPFARESSGPVIR